MKKLLELQEKLKKAKEELNKSLLGDMNPISSEINKKEDCEDDQKIVAEALDDHNENKHGEDKDEDSAKKSDIPKSITDQSTSEIIDDAGKSKPMETPAPVKVVKFEKNGQWSLK